MSMGKSVTPDGVRRSILADFAGGLMVIAT
jgi:hypothetical protein